MMATACNQCGEDAEEFREGVCVLCWNQNQSELDQHNAEQDRWKGMTDRERADEIRRAYD